VSASTADKFRSLNAQQALLIHVVSLSVHPGIASLSHWALQADASRDDTLRRAADAILLSHPVVSPEDCKKGVRKVRKRRRNVYRSKDTTSECIKKDGNDVVIYTEVRCSAVMYTEVKKRCHNVYRIEETTS